MVSRNRIEPGKRSNGTLRWTSVDHDAGSIRYESRMDINSPDMRIHYTWRKTGRYDYRYIPPNSSYFLCRACRNLTYTGCPESHKYDNLFAALATDSILSIAYGLFTDIV
jgi:hypothetical protein